MLKLLSVQNYTFPVPELTTQPMLFNNILITPTIVDAEATFITDAIKIAYKIDYK